MYLIPIICKDGPKLDFLFMASAFSKYIWGGGSVFFQRRWTCECARLTLSIGQPRPVMLSLVCRSEILSRTSRTRINGRKMSTKQFIDYFGAQVGAEKYAAARPTYPSSFLDAIVAKCPRTPCLWPSTLCVWFYYYFTDISLEIRPKIQKNPKRSSILVAALDRLLFISQPMQKSL